MLKIICSAVIHRPSARDSLLYTIEEHVPFGSVSLAKGCDRRRSSTELLRGDQLQTWTSSQSHLG